MEAIVFYATFLKKYPHYTTKNEKRKEKNGKNFKIIKNKEKITIRLEKKQKSRYNGT